MGARKCSVKGCSSCTNRPEDSGVTFHRFPANQEITKKWLQAGGFPATFSPTKGHHICSRHFCRTDFQDFKGKKYFLKQGSIPTIFTSLNVTPETTTETKSDEIPKATEKSENKVQESVDKVEEKKETVEVKPEEPAKKEEPVKKVDSPKKEDPAPVVVPEAAEKPVIDEKKPDPVVVAAPAAPVPPVLSPKKKRRSAPIKRYSDNSYVSQEPAKKVPKRVSLPKLKEKLEAAAPPAVPIAPTTPAIPVVPPVIPSDPVKVETLTPEVKAEATEKPPVVQAGPKKKNQINFVPGNTIEAQDFDGKWNSVKVIEVDTEDREVLVRFDNKSSKAKQSGTNEEWIPMDSSRLRSAQPAVTFEVGEKCLARWNDCRKFPATIQRVLENESYEVLFDDGYVKIVRGIHINKVQSKASKFGQEKQQFQPVVQPPPPSLIPDYVKSTPIPEVVNDGEWCCPWVDDIPIGVESSFDGPHGKVSSIIVPDKRVLPGWIKHFYLRPTGKWDVLFISPTGKKLRFKHELKAYLEENGQQFDAEAFDFSLHKKRSKTIGLYIYSDKLKQASVAQIDASSQGALQHLSQQSINHLANLGALPTIPSAVATGAPITPIESEIHIGSLKVKVVDNLFRCPQEKCGKTFRNQNHLQIHIKHYHREISKMMGVCPNMTDLAYLRTTGDETEVPETKLKSPKPVRKSLPPKLEGDVKAVEIKREKDIKKEVKHIRSPILEEALKAPPLLAPIVKEKIKVEEKVKEEIKVEQDLKPIINTPALNPKVELENMQDPEAMITSHSVSKSGVVRTTMGQSQKKRSKFRFGMKPKKAGLKKKKIGLIPKSVVHKVPRIQEPTESADPTYYPPPSKKRRKFTRGIIPYQANPSFYEGAIGGYDSQSSYLDENGQVIKIVRMRKEEVINCICGYYEEDGLMIQCELCLCWQHGGCNGIEKETQVPEKYVCYICKNPLKARQSQKYIHDQDWLYDGKLPIANYHLPNAKQTARFEKLKQCHTLIGNLREMEKFMHSLKVKKNIAAKRGHPKMYLWSKKWEASPTRQAQYLQTDDDKKVIKKELKFEDEEKPTVTPEVFHRSKIPEPEAAIDPAKCQRILLGHIEKQLKVAKNRYDQIEEQVAALEAMEDQKTPENDAKMKQTIYMLLKDLDKMRKIASIHATPGV